MEKFCFGKVVKLHGIAGQIKIATKIDFDFNLGKITSFFTENDDIFAVNRIFKTNDGVVVGLDGVDLDRAKTLLGTWLFIDRALLVGKILYEDLKGSEVKLSGGKIIGQIKDVQDYGSAEVLFISTAANGELLVPNVPNIIESFDYKSKQLILNESIFCEVCDYED